MSLFKTVKMSLQSVSTIRLYGKGSETLGALRTFRGTFQPADGEHMQSLPEGRRANGVFFVVSDLDFDTVTSTTNPDRVVINGRHYEIVSRMPWQNKILPHYEYLVQEIKAK